MEILSGMLSSLGLSGAAGLNAYFPLLVVGMLSKFGYLDLNAPYDLISNPWFMLLVGILGLLDFIGDKIPGVDHALHVVGGLVSTASGAILFASQSGAADVPEPVKLGLGLMVAGGVQATRTVVRPVSTATTGGLATPAVSAAEDIGSAALSLLAIFMPVLAVMGLAGFGVASYIAFTKLKPKKL